MCGGGERLTGTAITTSFILPNSAETNAAGIIQFRHNSHESFHSAAANIVFKARANTSGGDNRFRDHQHTTITNG